MGNIITVINSGNPGNNTWDGLERFKVDVFDKKPDFLIVFLGYNDSLYYGVKFLSLEDFRSNLQKMVTIAKENTIQNIILLRLYPVIDEYVKERHPAHPSVDINFHLLEYDKVIIEVAAENQIESIDLRILIESHGGATKNKMSLLRNEKNSGKKDGVHLTPKGYSLVAQLIYNSIKGRVKRGDVVVCLGDSITYGVHVKGAGTVTGETYPAELYRLLNK